MLDPRELQPERIRPITRAEYDQMVDAGMFDDERVELLYGVLVEMSPQGTRHAEAVSRFTEWFNRALEGRARARPALPYAASDFSEPEPDIALVEARDYSQQHPDRVFLLVEIADSSLRKDSTIKLRLYAECGVPEYWLVNVQERELTVFRDPLAGRYQSAETRGADDEIAPAAFPDVSHRVGDLVP